MLSALSRWSFGRQAEPDRVDVPTIRLDDVSVLHPVHRDELVLDSISISIPGNRRVGILGAPKCGKSTLLRILSGLDHPDRGRVFSTGRISFPVGFPVGLTPAHSLRRNITFAANVYRLDPIRTLELVTDAAELRPFLNMTFSAAPLEVSTRFKYALALCLPFDTFVFDANPVSPINDTPRLRALFEARARTCGTILCTSNEALAERYCDIVIYLRNGRLYPQPDKADAIAKFRKERQARALASIAGGAPVTKEEALLVREARGYLRLGAIETAEKRIEELESQTNDVWQVFLLRADVAVARNDPASALALLKSACDANPDASEPWIALQKLLTSDAPDPNAGLWATRMLVHVDVRVRLAGARLQATAGQPDALLDAWKRVVDGERDTTLGLNEAAQYQFARGCYDDVLATVAVALRINPDFWHMVLWKAKVERARGDVEAMADTAIQLAKMKPEAALQFLPALQKAGLDRAAYRLHEAAGTPNTPSPSTQQIENANDETADARAPREGV